LEEMDREEREDKVGALEAEIEALRESLIEAEEAMALAAARESGLSPEWVMMTITRYSAQLEEAQALIQALEDKLSHRERGPVDEVVILLAEELRTPITSIAGYTDLMLNETVGAVTTQQQEFLQRVKANSERIGTLLDQIIQLILVAEPTTPPQEPLADIQTAIETAVTSLITQIRESNLQLDLKIADHLPKIAVNPQTLHQIIANLLDNAVRSSGQNGRIAVRAHANAIDVSSNSEHPERLDFVHLEVTDSGGGINLEDLSRTFSPQQQTTEPLILGLGDTGAGLSVTQNLIESNGGRIWVDAEPGVGTTFSVLFPVSVENPKVFANGSA
ncbi:MAG: HAMP domain-containing sensor histidine kinase, partial [Chloroflexota bacterium]